MPDIGFLTVLIMGISYKFGLHIINTLVALTLPNLYFIYCLLGIHLNSLFISKQLYYLLVRD